MISSDEYRAVMGNLASGVPVVTTVWEGEFYGTTATAFSSVSLEPPLVQVTLHIKSNTRAVIEQSGIFAVNILAEDQKEIARDFATKGIDRFEKCPVKVGASGLPLIVGSIGTLECRMTQRFPGGDHVVVLGEVMHAYSEERPPLIYFKGRYRQLSGIQKEETP